MTAVWVLVYAMSLFGQPDMTGLATWYAHDEWFRDGTAFELDADVCAVDAALWYYWRGSTLAVASDAGVTMCQVRDTGYLYWAGAFEWGGYRWVRTTSERGLRIVADLPRETHRRISPDNDTRLVRVWRVN